MCVVTILFNKSFLFACPKYVRKSDTWNIVVVYINKDFFLMGVYLEIDNRIKYFKRNSPAENF